MFEFAKTKDQEKTYIIMLFDVRKFYDTLDPKILKKMWCSVLELRSLPEDHFSLYRSIIDYSVVEKNKMSMYLNNR